MKEVSRSEKTLLVTKYKKKKKVYLCFQSNGIVVKIILEEF